MEFLQQSITLLSEPPANIVFHLVTLFALQVVFAISFSRWRRDPDDVQAQHLTWASAGVFVGRLLLLFVGLLTSNNPQQLAATLPPLEQAINTMTIALIVWSFIPHAQYSNRIVDIALVIILALCGVLYLFFAQDWQNQINGGVTYYHSTLQSAIWTIIQIGILVAGLTFLLVKSERQHAMPIMTILVLLFSTVLQLFNQNEFIPSDTNIPYVIRLGFLIAFPLWAAYAYQYNLTPLLATQSEHQTAAMRYNHGLQDASQVIATRQLQRRIAKSIEMAANLLEAEFVAIGLVDVQTPFELTFNSNLLDDNTNENRIWTINLNKITTFSLALTQGNTTELLTEGLGARQLHDFYQSVGIEPRGPLLIHSLAADGRSLGLLIAGASVDVQTWPEEKRRLMPGIATYQAQAILNSQLTDVPVIAAPTPVIRASSSTVPSAILLDQVHLQTLQAENYQLKSELDTSRLETKQAVAKALAAQKQARHLAAALRAAQQASAESHTQQNEINVDTIISRPNSQ
ncbi:MAG: hypothetical protein R3293_23600 [Candidatus Promineifilaceae bacterium]|nr:hypothetical protein [Candidatus Promineifilaceae bacterium]